MSATTRPAEGAVDRVLRSRVARAMTYPHGLAGWLAPFAPTLTAAGDATRVTAVTLETDDTVTVTFRTPRSWAPPVAGQHVLLGVELDGRRHTRAFSLSSSARRDDGHATVTVRVNPDGVVSRHLVTACRTGDLVTVSPPRGDFLLPTSGRPLLLVAGGSGITPLASMLRTLVDDEAAGSATPPPTTLLAYTHELADLPFDDELVRLSVDHDWFDLVVVVTGDGPRRGSHGLAGRLHADHLAHVLTDLDVDDTLDVRACGPAGLVATLEELLDGDDRVAGLDVEYFHPPARESAASGGTITFATSGVTVTDDGRPLLDQAEDAGLTPQFGCRMGICHTCVRPKTAGVVTDVLTGQQADEDTDTVRLCVSAPCGDVTLDL